LGFGSFIGGILLCVLAVLVGLFGLVVLLGFVAFVDATFAVPLGIAMLVIALVMFLYGWYLYKSAKPRGTINVHNE